MISRCGDGHFTTRYFEPLSVGLAWRYCPGVLIGGQIGPRLPGKIKQRDLEIAIGVLFAAIGLAMLYAVYQEHA